MEQEIEIEREQEHPLLATGVIASAKPLPDPPAPQLPHQLNSEH